ncbi:ADP-ribosylation factor-like protein 6-interacting protein 1 isoform X2 [Aethina tumida]|uniref:ADP-ribosylation factor-like protein 6-interacting protein 1 isoform X2 n=1 Tax=Aethina tumida TaxID=116153 RepID=UPI00096B5CF5|nr:ADP-ribosylation factor-like protein 6-interacting protein 1 isoform X2 [Aethina tumida]
MSEEDAQIRRLKQSLEPLKELVVQANSVLLWEKDWHSSAIVGATTAFFTFTWLCDPSFLTMLSLLGIFITLADYTLPLIVNSLFKNEHWSAHKQKKFDEFCTNVILYKTKTELSITTFYKMRVNNPKMYFSLSLATLSLLAYVGSTINNFFLMYLFTSVILLFPGMVHSGWLNNVTEQFEKIFRHLIENAKSKVNRNKKEE